MEVSEIRKGISGVEAPDGLTYVFIVDEYCI